MKKHWFVLGLIATIALVASPFVASANSQQSGIWIVNETPNCLWATVYSAGKIVGRPGWFAANNKGVYSVTWKGIGQQFDVRTEILSTKNCQAQNAQNPLAADIRTTVQGSLAYTVRVVKNGNSFRLIRQ